MPKYRIVENTGYFLENWHTKENICTIRFTENTITILPLNENYKVDIISQKDAFKSLAIMVALANVSAITSMASIDAKEIYETIKELQKTFHISNEFAHNALSELLIDMKSSQESLDSHSSSRTGPQ